MFGMFEGVEKTLDCFDIVLSAAPVEEEVTAPMR